MKIQLCKYRTNSRLLEVATELGPYREPRAPAAIAEKKYFKMAGRKNTISKFTKEEDLYKSYVVIDRCLYGWIDV